ncbi:MAG: type II toxin-antitoxin system VapC family toxin [Acidobacteriota bacterium]
MIDASVLLAFYLPAERYKTEVLALLEEATAGGLKLVVPTLARYEVLNALSRAIRGLKSGQRISLREAQEILAAMDAIGLEQRDVANLEVDILAITEEYQTSAYDAAYLALAEQLGARLLTGDRRFFNAVRGAYRQVELVGDHEFRKG